MDGSNYNKLLVNYLLFVTFLLLIIIKNCSLNIFDNSYNKKCSIGDLILTFINQAKTMLLLFFFDMKVDIIKSPEKTRPNSKYNRHNFLLYNKNEKITEF